MKTITIIPNVATVQVSASGLPVYLTVWRRDYSALSIADALRKQYPRAYLSALASPIGAPYPTFTVANT